MTTNTTIEPAAGTAWGAAIHVDTHEIADTVTLTVDDSDGSELIEELSAGEARAVAAALAAAADDVDPPGLSDASESSASSALRAAAGLLDADDVAPVAVTVEQIGCVSIQIRRLDWAARLAGRLHAPRALRVSQSYGLPERGISSCWHVQISGSYPGTAGVEIVTSQSVTPSDADLAPLRALTGDREES